IPIRVHLGADIRDTDLRRRDSLIAAVDASCHAIAAKRAVTIRQELVNADAPGDCAANIVEALSESCRRHRLPFMPMVSRAYHDSLFMSRITPVGMLFIPCRNGYSHRPDEYASPDDIARGALILAETLGSLAG
ncbi:MAG TPA: M20/M25/M40 family metallo-hydrolase, partial [Candidatus Eremiobacteraceae bacterium]|nr:M20/M25/M40 family metallo-hydrolase [Candidatus Eremiobacteraceae bacterium]